VDAVKADEGNKLINRFEMEMFSPPCDPGSPVWGARLTTDADLSPLMPYVNAVKKNAIYDDRVPTVVWREGSHKYALRDKVISINNLKDRDHAERVAKKVIEELNQLWERRDQVEPDHTTRMPPKLLNVLKLLPRTNCKRCGLASCMAFAAQLIEGERCVEDCPPLLEEGMEDNLEGLRRLGL